MRKLLYIITLAVVFTSCATPMTRSQRYPKMYSEKPAVLLVMPPINRTTNVEAKEAFYTSMNTVLIEKGYYVVSPTLAADFLKSESGYDTEMFFEGELNQFGNVFGADAVIFTVIDKWEKNGFGINTDIHYVIKSTKSNEILFERKCNLFLDTSVSSSGGGVLGALVNIAATAINTATTKHIEAARKCNYFVFDDLPSGKYRIDYQNDGEIATGEPNISARVK